MLTLPLEDPILIVALLFVMILIVPLLSNLLRLPNMVLLILLGMTVGTHGLGIVQRDGQLILLEKMGLLYIMLLAGIQMDLSNLQRLGKGSLIFGSLTFSIPFSLGLLVGQILNLSFLAACIMGLIFSPHVLIAYPTITRLGLTRKEYIGITVGATAVTSFLTLAVFSVIQGNALGTLGLWFWLKLLLGLPILTLISLWTVPKLGRYFINDTNPNLTAQLVFILATLFVLSGLTALLGIDAIVGAFLAGLVLNPLIPLDSRLMKQTEFFGNSFFIPCFMISVGILCNPGIFITQPDILAVIALVFLFSVIGKAIPAALITQIYSFSKLEGLTIFSLTLARAALVVVIGLFAQQFDLITDELFNVAIAYILLTCLTGTILTEWAASRLVPGEHHE